MGLAFVASLWMAAAGAQPAPAKVPPELGREMAEAIVAVNKALGLESWPAQGVEPCVDRGGEGTTAKDVSAADTRRCAEKALAVDDFPNLGKGYALAIPMSSIGPITVVALGMEAAAGFAAYSCDPGRKCLPTKIQPGTKWGKRLVERQQKACAAPETVWIPATARVCPSP
ncbi:MAG TPA: hypothetical protein VIU64_22525 [Polyangia bacterium]